MGQLSIMNEKEEFFFNVKNVLYTPCLKSNILSLGQFDEHGCKILL